MNSCSYIEEGVGRIWRQLAVGDSLENDLPRGRNPDQEHRWARADNSESEKHDVAKRIVYSDQEPVRANPLPESSLQCLRQATETLCSSHTTLDELQSAASSVYDLFAGIMQRGSEPDDIDSNTGTILPEGKALSPKDAAGCILDFQRTNVFLRGLRSAIAEASARFPRETIHILYAGCGPFAPFCLLPILQFPAMDVQFTLLDIHQSSLDAARQLAETLGVQQRIRDYMCCDAPRTGATAGLQSTSS